MSREARVTTSLNMWYNKQWLAAQGRKHVSKSGSAEGDPGHAPGKVCRAPTNCSKGAAQGKTRSTRNSDLKSGRDSSPSPKAQAAELKDGTLLQPETHAKIPGNTVDRQQPGNWDVMAYTECAAAQRATGTTIKEPRHTCNKGDKGSSPL